MQYTLRKIPKQVDAALRRRAKREGKTLNQVALETLTQGLGLEIPEPVRRRSLRDLIGALPNQPDLEVALRDQRKIDPELWR